MSKKVHQQSEDIEGGEVESTLVLIVHCIHKPKYIMRALCRVILKQTVEPLGKQSQVFLSKLLCVKTMVYVLPFLELLSSPYGDCSTTGNPTIFWPSHHAGRSYIIGHVGNSRSK